MKREEFYSFMSRLRLTELVRELPTPCYLFFVQLIERQLARVRETLGERFEVYYAAKANPHPEILRLMGRHGLGVDVASGGELAQAVACGIPPERLSFAGPGKSPGELQQAVGQQIGSLSVESLEELELLAQVAGERRQRARVSLRVNEGSGSSRAGLRMGGSTQFGLPTEQLHEAFSLLQASADWLEFVGLHVHSGSQVLEAQALVLQFESLFRLAHRCEQEFQVRVRRLNFGGGWGIAYFAQQSPLDLERLQVGLAELLQAPWVRELAERATLVVEPGRFLVAESGLYVTQVLYRKEVRERRFLIVDGGMHHNYVLAGGMGQVLRRNFEFDHLPLSQPQGPQGELLFDVAGCLCTPQDVLAMQVPCEGLPARGDRLVFFNSGAYGLSASPTSFLSHEPPHVRFLESGVEG